MNRIPLWRIAGRCPARAAAIALAGAWLAVALSAGARAPARAPEGLPESLLPELRTPSALPAGRYEAAGEWEAEGKRAAHIIGRAVADAGASGGRAWQARPYADRPNSYLLYGPYAELAPGDYVAFFRVKLLEGAGEERVADVDAVTNSAAEPLRRAPVRGSELAVGRWASVPLAFHYPGGRLECRILWTGYAGLRVDRVALYRLQGGHIDTEAGRVPQPRASGKPNGLALEGKATPAPPLFPRSAAPASTLVVADISRLTPDAQLCVVSLQGLVNRSKPRLYCLLSEFDSSWLNWIRRNKWAGAARTERDWRKLLTRYRGAYRGVVITDPALPATKNVATMIAGLDDALVVSPRLAAQLRLPVVADLRGRWRTSLAAYAWAFERLWPRLNHRLAACLWPDSPGLRDYLVQHRAVIFWLPGRIDGARTYERPEAEVRQVEELLARMPANSPIMGYPWAGKDVGIGELPGVALFSEFGHYLVGSVDCTNLSVHSGIAGVSLHQRRPPAPRLDAGKVYVSYIMSDGDNLPVLTTVNFPQLWNDPNRGKFPIGWTLSPSASLLMPDVVSYYYSTATPQDAFVAGVSGVGYTYPDLYGQRYREPDRPRVYDGFLDLTAKYMRAADLRSAWVMNATRPEVIRRYAERIPFLEALFPDYGQRVQTYAEATYPTARNMPVFHGVTGWREDASREEKIREMVEQVRAFTPKERPAFLHLFVWNWGADLGALREVLHRLGGDYTAVRPDHLAALYRQYLVRREFLARFPDTLVALDTGRAVLTGIVQNVSAHPLTLRFSAMDGLDAPTITPASVTLAPSASAPIEVAGTVTADRVDLEVRGARGAERVSVTARRVPAAEMAGPVPGDAALRFVRVFEAEGLAHLDGSAEADADAGARRVWVARPGDDEPGYVAFGPYQPLPKGRYLVVFRVRRAGPGDGRAATLDVSTDGGGKVLASRDLAGADLPAAAFRSFPLVVDHPGGPLETRVQWHGTVPLAMDSVAVWELVPR